MMQEHGSCTTWWVHLLGCTTLSAAKQGSYGTAAAKQQERTTCKSAKQRSLLTVIALPYSSDHCTAYTSPEISIA
jgi:hypothetical protein